MNHPVIRSSAQMAIPGAGGNMPDPNNNLIPANCLQGFSFYEEHPGVISLIIILWFWDWWEPVEGEV